MFISAGLTVILAGISVITAGLSSDLAGFTFKTAGLCLAVPGLQSDHDAFRDVQGRICPNPAIILSRAVKIELFDRYTS
jgi:UPF0716 family protein affecting phage T7 exclusion